MNAELQKLWNETRPRECNCPEKTCKPEQNEGCYCWRSGFVIPVGEFSRQPSKSSVRIEPPHGV